MEQAFHAALSHPRPSARLLATYSDYAWNVLDQHALGERMIARAVRAAPSEPAYRITLARMLLAQQRYAEAAKVIEQLKALNIGGRLDGTIAELKAASATTRIN
jgi:Tfp pilus assembly protein PilF